MSPPTVIAIVMALAAFSSFWMSFDRRVTTVESDVKSVSTALAEHKADERETLKSMNEKLDRLIEARVK